MPDTILPISVYPNNYDTDRNLFQVYNTSETVLSATLNSWDIVIQIVPETADSPELWATSGYVTIEGELIYYASVHVNDDGKIDTLQNCIRRVNGTPPRNFNVGTSVRGFVIAEHHNNLARGLVNIENFVGTLTTTNQETIYWKLLQIANLAPLTDDAGCPQIEFYYRIISTSPIEGTEISYSLNITGTINSFTIDFGDGTTESTQQNGTHFYPPNKRIDPVVTVDTDACESLQTSAERLRVDDVSQQTIVGQQTFPIIVPPIPDFPNLDLAVVNEVPNNFQFPPIVFPCLDIGPFGPIVVPSTISIINPYPIPSVITFEDVPNFPSNIVITSSVNLPSVISIVNTLPSNIRVSVISNIPSTISVIQNIPSIINVNVPSNMSISIVNNLPSVISVNSNIPSIIQVEDLSASLDVFLNSDYCTNCTGSFGASANGATIQVPTDSGCDPCAGANPKITKVTAVLHDFIVTTLDPANPVSTRYDLVKVLLVAPDGTNCLLMGGAQAGATNIPQFTMNEPVTLTFADGSQNDIYDFSVPLDTKTYAPNANGNNASRTAGQVALNLPAPPPTGATGYGTNLSVFTDSPLTKGNWYAYVSVGPSGGAYPNICNVGKACVRVSSAQESPCDFASPTPTASGKPPATPVATPRKTPLPTPLPTTAKPTPAPTTPPPTPSPSPPNPSGIPIILPSAGPDGPPFDPDPPNPITLTPRPSYTPYPTPTPSATFTCGTCTYVPQLEDCGSGVCTYYWDGTSWGRCAECTSCNDAGENCGCPEARIMRAFNILPPNGENNPDVNTHCYKVTWTDQALIDCNGGFCTYSFNISTGLWEYCSSCSFCSGLGDNYCKCQDPNTVLVPAGILPANPGTNATEHRNCYKLNNSQNNCVPGQCECPPAPTSQFITGSIQQIRLNCKKTCGGCYSMYSIDKGSPCDPDPADWSCGYEFTDDNWDLTNDFCPCTGMECLEGEIAVEYGLLPRVAEQGEIKRLSCYRAEWESWDDCNPDNPDCKCPPTPTPVLSGANAGQMYVESGCQLPTPTPSPTQGCGACNFKFDALECSFGQCVYTYYAGIQTWQLTENTCDENEGFCNCSSVDEAKLAGWFPEFPTDRATVTKSCYEKTGSGTGAALMGSWISTGNNCTANVCKCPGTTPTHDGYYADQKWSIDCVPLPTPTPTSGPSCGGNCSASWISSCSGQCYYKQVDGVWSFDSSTASSPCVCPTVEQVASSLAYFGSLGGAQLPPIFPLNPNYGFWAFADGCFEKLRCRCSTPPPYPQSAFRTIVPCEPKPSATPTPTPCGATPSPTPSPSPSGDGSCVGSTSPLRNGPDNVKVFALPYSRFTYKYSGTYSSWSDNYNPVCIEAITEDAPSFLGDQCGTPYAENFRTNYVGRNNTAVFKIYPPVSRIELLINGPNIPQAIPGEAYVEFKSFLGDLSNPVSTVMTMMPPNCGISWDINRRNQVNILNQAGPVGFNFIIRSESGKFDIFTIALIGDTPIGIRSVITEDIILENPKPAAAFSVSNYVLADEPVASHAPILVAEGTQVSLVPVSKERAKLCKYAGKTPLQMVKQNCGACAVRSCEKFGLCSHSGVVDGRDDIYCCQLCDEYTTESAKLESKQVIVAPKSESVTSETKMSSQSVNSVVQAPSQAQQIPNIPDSFSAADKHMAKSNMVKISPANLSIRVNINELVEGKDDQGAKG